MLGVSRHLECIIESQPWSIARDLTPDGKRCDDGHALAGVKELSNKYGFLQGVNIYEDLWDLSLGCEGCHDGHVLAGVKLGIILNVEYAVISPILGFLKDL